MSAIRHLIRYSLPVAFLSMSGCVSVIESLADRQPQGLSNAPRMLSVPRAQTRAYESPIPRWNSAYQGATSNQTPAEKKSLVRAYQMLDVADAITAVMSGLLDPNSPDQLTPLALSFCLSGGVPHREKDWFGNVFSLQPGGLATSIFE